MEKCSLIQHKSTHTQEMQAQSHFDKLDNQYLSLWNNWYDAASQNKPNSVDLAKDLLHFLTSKDGKNLIKEAQKRIDEQHIQVPNLHSFEHQVQASINSLKTYIKNPEIVPQAASEYLSNMQAYLFKCRDNT
jgi:hypothetical protein